MRIFIIIFFGLISFSIRSQEKELSKTNLSDIIERINNLRPTLSPITDYFTADEIEVLRSHYSRPYYQYPQKSLGPGDTAYIVENNGNFLGTTSVIGASGFNFLWPSGNGQVDVGGAVTPDGSTAYSLGNYGAFYQINLSSGVYSPLANFTNPSIEWSSLEFDPTDGTLYALSTSESVGGPTFLCKINFSPTLDIEIIGSNSIQLASSLAIDGDGKIYTHSIATDLIYEIDKTDGSSSVVGSTGFDAQFGVGMCWDPFQNRVLMSAFNNDEMEVQLRTVNTNTGMTTNLFPILPVGFQCSWLSIGGSILSTDGFNSEEKLLIYPNPAVDELFFSGNLNDQAMNYEILAVNGILVEKGSLNADSINISHLNSGLYFIRITSNNGQITVKRILKK